MLKIFTVAAIQNEKDVHRRKNPIKQARLDFFLISKSLQAMTPCIKFENSCRSGHSPVVFYCKIKNLKRSRGLRRFNNSQLADKDYVKVNKKKNR